MLARRLRVTRRDVERIQDQAMARAEIHNQMIKKITYSTLRAAAVISLNALFMFVVEVLIEVGVVTTLLPKIPFRLDFLSLTTLSGLLGYQTIAGLKHGEIEVTGNALAVSAFVESALIIGDILYLVEEGEEYPIVYYIRSPFMVLTFLNFVLVIWLSYTLHSWWCCRSNQANPSDRIEQDVYTSELEDIDIHREPKVDVETPRDNPGVQLNATVPTPPTAIATDSFEHIVDEDIILAEKEDESEHEDRTT